MIHIETSGKATQKEKERQNAKSASILKGRDKI